MHGPATQKSVLIQAACYWCGLGRRVMKHGRSIRQEVLLLFTPHSQERVPRVSDSLLYNGFGTNVVGGYQARLSFINIRLYKKLTSYYSTLNK